MVEATLTATVAVVITTTEAIATAVTATVVIASALVARASAAAVDIAVGSWGLVVGPRGAVVGLGLGRDRPLAPTGAGRRGSCTAASAVARLKAVAVASPKAAASEVGRTGVVVVAARAAGAWGP